VFAVAQSQLGIKASLRPPFTLQDAGNEGWIGANASRLRALPLVAGASGIVGVLLNRILFSESQVFLHVWLDVTEPDVSYKSVKYCLHE